ncbi:nucleoside hydrolase [Streptomyces liangshanensis]|uniref:nucleoside hydrolase n=1 Tax=Streptomyces liangshanensis TaxID=2717324 RepID=UPI001AAEFEB4|nr:nucleoside hydrolase [Streptomyces liangshanensis]
MNTAPIPLYLDCDTGVDDALALAYLFNAPAAELAGVGTVFGNVTSAEGAANTAALLGLAGRSDVPVAVGAHDPIAGTFGGGARHVHGHNGVGGVDLPPGHRPGAETAAEMLVRLAHEHPHTLHVLTTAPLTNIAEALRIEPDLPALVANLTVMGGAVWVPGNVTPVAEANVANDPEAARVVLRAGFRTLLVPLDVTLRHHFDDTDADLFTHAGPPLHAALGQMLRHYVGFYESIGSGRRAPLHDPLAAAIAVGEVATTQVRGTALDVLLEAEDRGRTVAVDDPGVPKVGVVVEADPAAAAVIRERIMATAPLTAA